MESLTIATLCWQVLSAGMEIPQTGEHIEPNLAVAGETSPWVVFGRRIRAAPCGPGEKPVVPSTLPPRESYWPKTVEDAVEQLVSELDDESRSRLRATGRADLIQYHHGFGTSIRNRFGLWASNEALRRSCGAPDMHPDTCSGIIIERLWERLQGSPE